MRIKTISIFVFFIVFQGLVHSQDIHFSNYYLSPLSLNPANTGNYVGNWRLMSNYRQQGENMANTYSSATLAYDRPVYIKTEKLSLGFIYLYDNSANNSLLVNKLYLSAGFFKRITTRSYLHIGLQGGFVHKRYSLNGLTLPDQFDMGTGYFDPQSPTQEVFEDQNLSYIDLNWGLIWSRKAPRLSTELGVAMFHYNLPKETFLGSDNRLEPKYQVHGLAKNKLNDYIYMRVQALYTLQAKSNELLAGADVGLMLANAEKLSDFYAGVHFRGGYNRISDAIIVKSGLTYGSCTIAFAYDMEIAGQKIAQFSGNAFEVTLTFTRPETKIRERTIPCDIF